MEKQFYQNNRKKLMDSVDNNSIVLMFAGRAPYKSADQTYDFTPNRNFYYLTGIDRENMILMMVKKNDIVTETLFIEKSDPVLARWVGERMSSEEAKNLSGIEDVEYIEKFTDSFGFQLERYEFNNLYLDLERAEWDIPLSESQKFVKEAREKYAFLNIKNIYHRISELRMIKSKEEVELIKKAIDITGKGIDLMMENARPNMMECEIEAYFDFVLKSNGVKDYAFKSIAAAGINGTVLHYSENNCVASDKELILFDVGAQYKYYNGDISRTFPVNGKFTERQKQIYNLVLKANDAIIDATKPGVPFKNLNELCKKILADGLKELGLIKEDNELSKYYFHGVSHYLGADDHDVGNYDVDLKPGMVISDEPGLYIPEEKIGIRIEDDLLVTENGCEVLSKDIVKTVDEIEKFMSNAKNKSKK